MKEAARKLLDKARRAIGAAETLLQAGDMEFAAGRAYYAMFYAAEAFLNELGFAFANTAACTQPLGSTASRPA